MCNDWKANIVIGLFVFNIPAATRILFFIAGTVVLGAAGMEMVGGNCGSSQGWSAFGTNKVDIVYAMIITLEEFLEMVGIIIFIHALLGYYLKSAGSADFLLRLAEQSDQPSIGTANRRRPIPAVLKKSMMRVS